MAEVKNTSPSISELSQHAGEIVTLKGWLYQRRAGGKIRFLVLRDGSGYLQGVVSKAEVPEGVWNEADRATLLARETSSASVNLSRLRSTAGIMTPTTCGLSMMYLLAYARKSAGVRFAISSTYFM